MLAVNRNLINFKSNPYRDAESARLREIERQRDVSMANIETPQKQNDISFLFPI